ncbi:DNA polymerase [Escherichia coli]
MRLIYGMSAFGLARRLNIPRKEAQESTWTFALEHYPGVWIIEAHRAQAKEQGYVETAATERRFCICQIRSSNGASSCSS